jgi:hypothetical protein
MTSTLNLSADMLALEDITDRVDELREEREDLVDAESDADSARDGDLENHDAWITAREALAAWDHENGDELANLEAILDDCQGNGGDHQWDGNWYPQHLIARSYFVEYIKDLIHDCYEIKQSSEWPYRHMSLDYEAAAEEAEADYTEVTVDGSEYLCR